MSIILSITFRDTGASSCSYNFSLVPAVPVPLNSLPHELPRSETVSPSPGHDVSPQLTTVLLIGAIETVLPSITQLLLLHTAQHITGHLPRATAHGWEGPGGDTLACRQDTTTVS